MKTFFNVEDLGDLKAALAEAQEVKANRFGYQELGKNKTLLMIFFNNSLRTRLSTQKAAMNLGMNVIVLDVNAGAMGAHNVSGENRIKAAPRYRMRVAAGMAM